MKATLKDIFSENISTRYAYFENHNKVIVEKCLEIKDKSKKEYFEKLFDLNFKFFGLLKIFKKR